MRIHIYYGGRGLIEDSNLYVLSRITEVLEELRVEVKRYNLYECKNEIAVLASGIKEADGVILAASVEWYGIGGLLQQFLDDCWLYADKGKLGSLYMMPVVVSTTYGEREAEQNLMKSWELLGGSLCPGITAYVENQAEFETNGNYSKVIENRAENLYRTINQKIKALPSSTTALKQTISGSVPMELTPQESEQLSKYVSDDSYVKKQKADIEELSQLFKEMMDRTDGKDSSQEFIRNLKDNFKAPKEEVKAIFEIRMTDNNKTLIVDVDKDKLNCYYGDSDYADVVATCDTLAMKELRIFSRFSRDSAI